MSETPETDAALYPMDQVDIVWPEFARKLERERDEAIELLASEKITRDHVIKRGIEMQKERDEAREAADNLIEYAWRCLAELEKFGKGYARYEREMNEIRVDIARVNWKEGAK